MLKSWKRVLILFAIALACWFVEIVIIPSNFEMLLVITAVVSSILCICFFAVAVIRQIKPHISGYKIFALEDAIIGICVTAYAIYDILTDTGWFAGIVGVLLLIFVLPVILLLLIIDFVLYMRNKRKKG